MPDLVNSETIETTDSAETQESAETPDSADTIDTPETAGTHAGGGASAAGIRPGTTESAAFSREDGRRLIAGMAVESWRFGRVFLRLLARADAGEQGRFESQLRWFVKKVEEAMGEAGMKIVTLEGSPYDPGMPATPVNIEDFEAGDELWVDQMLEPVIIDAANESAVLRSGTVTLKKAGAERP
ncbi:MAG: hypothetical protein LBQ12_10315 [Deltaproteobacteria bacterium]|jgi:hypothetical protein|nr:hypothetical protein [Deltaproteobacteria bacterium]